jgi:hypothetical protein
MVTRFVLPKLPPVYVPPITSVELVPGVELVKLTVVLIVAPGAKLPSDCGSGDPFAAPSFALVSMTLLASVRCSGGVQAEQVIVVGRRAQRIRPVKTYRSARVRNRRQALVVQALDCESRIWK